jgi:hypothetical protein
MRRLLERVLVRLLIWLPGPVAEWTAADAGNLAMFLKSDSGKKLVRYLRMSGATAAATAVSDGDHLAWRCGQAHGIRTVAMQFELLSRPERVERPEDEATPPIPSELEGD